MLYNLAHILFFSATYAAILAQNETEISASEEEVLTLTTPHIPTIVETTHISSEEISEEEEDHFEHKTDFHEHEEEIKQFEHKTNFHEPEKEINHFAHTTSFHESEEEINHFEHTTSFHESEEEEITTTVTIPATEEITTTVTIPATEEYVPEIFTEKQTLPDNLPETTTKEERPADIIRWPPPSESSGSEIVNSTKVYDVDAECQNDSMRIAITFNGSFNGLIYTSNYPSDPSCICINGTGANRYDFFIELNKCGTLYGRPKAQQDQIKKSMWNTLSVQYNPLIEGDQDEHIEVTCDYAFDFWKTVSFPFVEVQSVSEKVGPPRSMHFSLISPECYMEIKQGLGLEGPTIQGSVSVGDPLTLVIHMRSKINEFDVIINNCVAHNGGQKRITLIDKYGCPADEKLISEFHGVNIHNKLFETQIFAYFKAFRFTGSPALYLECDVRMCHGKCPSQRCNWRRNKRSTHHLRDSSLISNPLKMMKSLDVRTDILFNHKPTQIDDVTRRLTM